MVVIVDVYDKFIVLMVEFNNVVLFMEIESVMGIDSYEIVVSLLSLIF